MRSGISTACLYPMPLEDAFFTLLQMNFHVFEIFINTVSELRADYLMKLKNEAGNTGGQVKSIHPFTSGYESFLLFSDYERRFWDGVEFYKRYFEACNLLGATILVLHGQRNDKCAAKEKNERYFERYARLFETGRAFGVTVAQENVSQFRGNDPGFVTEMRKYCGKDCAFVLDIKQAVRGGRDPFALCSAMGDRVVHVHLNDNRPGFDCLLPGFGTMDYHALIETLKRNGFDGDLIIEVYRNSFDSLEELFQAARTVNGLILE